MSDPQGQSLAPAGAARGERRAWDLLARAAASPPDSAPLQGIRELLCFELAGSAYAVPVERVREVVRLRALTPIPRAPDWVCGVIALRGEVVQVVDLCTRLRLPQAGETPRARVIVLHGEGGRVTGVRADAVRGVLRPREEAFRPNASADGLAVAELCHHGGEFVSVIDLDRILDFDASGD